MCEMSSRQRIQLRRLSISTSAMSRQFSSTSTRLSAPFILSSAYLNLGPESIPPLAFVDLRMPSVSRASHRAQSSKAHAIFRAVSSPDGAVSASGGERCCQSCQRPFISSRERGDTPLTRRL